MVSHAGAFSYNGIGGDVASFTLGTGWIDTAGWAVAQRLVNRFAVNDRPAFMIRGAEDATYSHKQIDADLWIEYWPYPTVTAASPAANTTGASLRPTLKVTTTNPTGGSQWFGFEVSSTPDMANLVAASGWLPTSEWVVPEGALRPGTDYYWRGSEYDEYHGHLGQSTERKTPPVKLTTNQVPLPPNDASATPGNEQGIPQTLTTLTPQLQVSATPDSDSVNDGAPLRYRFKISTGPDGKSGSVVTSNWLASANGKATWTVPEGTLSDGGIYTWIVQSFDGKDQNTFNTWKRTFKVDLRLGSTGPSPFDTAGPATVNLANGNANLSFSSPTVQTLGGPMGMSFSYNSQEVKNANRGLNGEYFDARVNGTPPTSPAGFTFDGKTPVFVRTDSAVSFDWGSNSPADAVPADAFLARWTGFVGVPQALATVPLQFGVRQDDGARLWIDDVQKVNNWTNTPPVVNYEASAQLYGSSAKRVRFEYYDQSQVAVAEMWVKYTVAGKTTEMIVPPDWFTKTVRILPAGWSASTPIAGPGATWANAQITDTAVVLTDATGKVHTYSHSKDAAGNLTKGGYSPPSGEYGVVSLDGTGLVVFTDEDGTVYQFSKEGRVASSTPVADAAKPAAPIPVLNARGVTTQINDPVSKDGTSFLRRVVFTYQTDALTACPQPTGPDYAVAPVDMLCGINYPDGSTTSLYYNGTGQLAAILDPGSELTSFGYSNTTDRLLAWIRDPVANDSLASSGATPSAASTTQINYDASNRVADVVLPAPDGITGSTRPIRTYNYGQGDYPRTSTVVVAGLAGNAATVTFDAAWRKLSETTALGVTNRQEWMPSKDLVLSSTDNLGRKSTIIYDPATDRASDIYGPAPSACYQSGGRPVANPTDIPGCEFLPAHSSAEYDGGLNGLQAAYYNNKTLAGKPALFGTGVGGTGGSVDRHWGTASPGSPIAVDAWSLRLTGLITFPHAGAYTLRTTSDDGARLWLNDILTVDRWTAQSMSDATSAVFTVAAGETRRIRLEYFDGDVDAALQLKWATPSSNGSFSIIPGFQLRPDYGLITSTTVDDSSSLVGTQAPAVSRAISYQHPWLGQATELKVDPAGLALTTKSEFEQPGGTGWLRRTSRTLPAGNGVGASAQSRSTYYGNLESAPVVCGLPGGTLQFGAAKTLTGPDPSSNLPVVTEYVYDVMGRAVGTKTTGDTEWTCETLDARGRPVSSVAAGGNGVANVTTTTSYLPTASGRKIITSTNAAMGSPNGSTVTSELDFLGRVTRYVDVWNTVTTKAYENLTGRLSATTTTPANGGSSTTAYSYDLDGKPLTVSIEGQTVASVGYDAQQQLSSVNYAGGPRSDPSLGTQPVEIPGRFGRFRTPRP